MIHPAVGGVGTRQVFGYPLSGEAQSRANWAVGLATKMVPGMDSPTAKRTGARLGRGSGTALEQETAASKDLPSGRMKVAHLAAMLVGSWAGYWGGCSALPMGERTEGCLELQSVGERAVERAVWSACSKAKRSVAVTALEWATRSGACWAVESVGGTAARSEQQSEIRWDGLLALLMAEVWARWLGPQRALASAHSWASQRVQSLVLKWDSH